MEPEASIILPAYNSAGELGGALDSVLDDQRGTRLEVVVVDDASADGTAAVAAAYAARDRRVRPIRARTNGGPARARNLALDACRGEWIAPLDADDRFAPGRLARLIALGRDAGADMVADNIAYRDPATGRSLGTALSPDGAPTELDAETFVRRNRHLFGEDGFDLGYLKPLVRRRFIAAHGVRYREELRIGEDYHFYLDCLLAGARWLFMPEPLYAYSLAPGSTSRRLTVDDVRRLGTANGHALAGLRAAAGHPPPGVVDALRARQADLDRTLAFMRFVELVKRRSLGSAAALLLWRRPDVWPLVARAGREGVAKRMGRLPFYGRQATTDARAVGRGPG